MPNTRQQLRDLDFRLQVTPKGTISEVRGNDAIKQSIKTILSTIPGERVRLPDFGSRVYSLLFEPMDEDTAEEIRDSIEDALATYENRIRLRRVNVFPNFDSNYYEIEIIYSNNTTGQQDTFVATMRAIGN